MCEEGSSSTFNNITLGSRQKLITVQDLPEIQALEEKIYSQFRDKLQKFLLAELGGEIPEDNLTVHLSTQVCKHFLSHNKFL